MEFFSIEMPQSLLSKAKKTTKKQKGIRTTTTTTTNNFDQMKQYVEEAMKKDYSINLPG